MLVAVRFKVIRTLLLLPIRDNSGRLFPRRLWESLEARLLRFGGFTQSSGVWGVWRDGDRTFRDESRKYVVALSSWTQFPAWLEIAQWARHAFSQEALYVEVAGVPEILTGPHGERE